MTIDKNPHSVLVVEDEWLIADLLSATLQDAGFVVIGPARRVKDALALIEKERSDAALLDVSLGHERSFPVAKCLAERNVPFLFMTGYSHLDFPQEYSNCAKLTKPVILSELLAALELLTVPALKS